MYIARGSSDSTLADTKTKLQTLKPLSKDSEKLPLQPKEEKRVSTARGCVAFFPQNKTYFLDWYAFIYLPISRCRRKPSGNTADRQVQGSGHFCSCSRAGGHVDLMNCCDHERYSSAKMPMSMHVPSQTATDFLYPFNNLTGNFPCVFIYLST